MKKYIIIATMALILEVGSTFYISYVSDKNLFGMIIFASIGPFLGLPFVGYMVESKTWSERFKMALSSSIGYLIGSIITYFMITKYDIY
jgi:fucose permease